MTEATANTGGLMQDRGPAAPTPGEILRKLREEKGLTHAAVGEALHLTGHYVRALEADDYSKLPALAFVKGYLRAYARFIGADVDTVLGKFEAHITGLADAGKQTERVQRSQRRHDQALRWAIGAGLVVVAGLVAGWWFVSGRPAPAGASQSSAPAAQTTAAGQTPAGLTTTVARAGNAPITTPGATPVAGTYAPATALTTGNAAAPQTQPGAPAALADIPAPEAAEPAESTADSTAATAVETAASVETTPGEQTTEPLAGTATETPAAAEDGAITITPAANGARQVSLISLGADVLLVKFSGNSWIEVDDGQNIRLYNDMLNAGDTLTIRGAAPFHVLLGDARQVTVSVNAIDIDISADIRADSTARLVLGELAGQDAGGAEVPL